MKNIFEKALIGGLSLSNRFIYSATWDGLADNKGFCTQNNIQSLTQRANGGVGLIITGMAFVKLGGKAIPWQLAVYDDKFIGGLTKMTTAIHAAQGKIVLQLSHGGCYATSVLSGVEAMGPSDNTTENFPSCRGMSVEEIDEVVQAFGKAAGRAKKAGFDGVQLHAAHV